MTSLTSRGFLVLRFWNDEVLKQIYAVLESNSARVEAKRSRVTTAIGIFKGTLTHTLSHIYVGEGSEKKRR
jgi:hypothetical protein